MFDPSLPGLDEVLQRMIEAAFEEMDIKQEIFAKLDEDAVEHHEGPLPLELLLGRARFDGLA